MKQLAQSKEDSSRIKILTSLAASYIVEGRAPNRMDSVAYYLKRAKELNAVFRISKLQNRINLYSALLYFTVFSSDDSRIIFLPVIDSCRKTRDTINEAQAWMSLGYTIAEDPPSIPYKLNCYQNALALANQAGDSFTVLQLQEEIAHVHVLQNKFDQAEQEFFLVLQQAPKISPLLLMFTYDRMAHLYLTKGQLNKALEYGLKTQRMMGITRDSAFADEFFNRLVSIYRALGKDAELHSWAKKQLEFDLNAKDIPGVYNHIVVLSRLIREEGNAQEVFELIRRKFRERKPRSINDQRRVQQAMGDTYNYLKQYDLAEKCYLEMIRLGNLQPNHFAIWDKALNNYTVGKFYCDRGLYSRAQPFLKISLKNFETYSTVSRIMTNHLLLFKTDSALGNYISAIHHLQESNRLRDSIFTVAKSKQVEELQVAYNTEQKDKSIKLLGEKEKLAQVQLQNARNTRNWIIAGASMLLIIAGLLYRQTVMRKRNNIIIRGKNNQLQHLVTEKEWLLKEVHHRVKNNLHTVIGLLESQALYLQDDALLANEISKHRIYAMSLIHQQLYKGEDIKTIDMAVFLPELLDYLSESFGTDRRIRFVKEIQSIKLNVSQAIPVALIVNEAVTNSIKYAFSDDKPGIINITMQQSADKINLIIADNGVGMDSTIISSKTSSMGLNLMHGLTREMDGEIIIKKENGTKISVSFGPDPLNELNTHPLYTLSSYN
jgi:two-component sensor histidine kinase